MSCEDLLSIENLKNAKLDATTIAEVATSREGGVSTGNIIDTTENRFNESISTLRGRTAQIGYNPPVDYSASIAFTVDDGTKTIDRNGVIYAPLPSALPFTTSGTWEGDDIDNFFVVQQISPIVPDYPALSALDSSNLVDGQVVTVTDTGRSGQFKVSKSNLSAEVTADPASGIYVPFGSDITGASGGFIRLTQGRNGYLEWYGGLGDGSFNNSQIAINALSGPWTNVLISGGTQGFVFDDPVTVPAGKALLGEYKFIDPRNGADFNDANYPDRILLNSSATITLDESASVSGLPILRKGIILPANAAEVAKFSGNAITIAQGKHGQYVGHCAIIGFDIAIYDDPTQNTENLRFEYLNSDCNNGILCDKNFDIVYIENVHCWPAASVGLPSPLDADFQRTGTAFQFKNGGDWNRWTNCFSYGYQNGFVNNGCNSVTALLCGADYTATQSTNPIGIQCIGDSAEMRMIGCQVAGQGVGYYINSSSTNNHVQMIGCNSWEADQHHVLNDSGQVHINGGRLRGGSAAGVTPNDKGPTILSGVSFESLTLAINNQVTTNVVRWDSMCTFKNIATIAINSYIPTVASQDPLPLNGEDVFFDVSGSVNFGTIMKSEAYAGKIVTFFFSGSPEVVDGGNMNLNASFMAAPGYTLTLLSTGSSWVELSRSAN